MAKKVLEFTVLPNIRGGGNSSRSGNFILKISQGKLKEFNTTDLTPLRAGRNTWGHCNLTTIFGSGKSYFYKGKVREFWEVMSVATMIWFSSRDICYSGLGAHVRDSFQSERNWRRADQNSSVASDVFQRKQVIIWKQNESVNLRKTKRQFDVVCPNFLVRLYVQGYFFQCKA